MEAIILAAGKGKRITQLLNGRPKCMLAIGGELLIDRIVISLAACGVTKIVVCCGYGAGHLKQHLRGSFGQLPIVFSYNPFYGFTNNSLTLFLARRKVRGDFLIINGDNLIEPEIMQRVIAHPGTVLPIIRKSKYDREDMKVTTDREGAVTRISKQITADIAGEAIGIRKIAAGDRRAFWSALGCLVLRRRQFQAFYTEAFQIMIEEGRRLPILDVSDCYYDEVDNAADLKRVRQTNNSRQ